MGGEFWFIGECMLEMQPGLQDRTVFATSIAGDTYNTAVYFKRLLPRATASYVSALGEDGLSLRMRGEMGQHGIDDALVAAVPGRQPGLYLIETDDAGERRFDYWRAQSAARVMLSGEHLQKVRTALPSCGGLYFTGITLAILDVPRRLALLALAAEVRRSGGWVVIDNNFRAALWPLDEAADWLARALASCSHALLGYDDEVALHGDADPQAAMRRLRASHPGVEFVLKLGADGCLVSAPGAPVVTVAAPKVTALDTTAAGDSFNAGYLAARCTGLGGVVAAERGCQLAARVVGQRGAIIAPALMADLAEGGHA